MSPADADARAADPDAERILAMLEVRGWADLTNVGTLASAGASRRRAIGRARSKDARRPRRRPDARQAMLEVFAVLGDDDELVPEYRRRLASALF
jgi:hypothetical protein